MRTRVRGLVVALALVASAGCTSDDSSVGSDERNDSDSSVALFDASVVHEIAVSFDEGAYDEMVTTFADSGEKTWIEATVTIDGQVFDRSGLRLKGNSSLAGLGGQFGPAAGGGQGRPDGGGGQFGPGGGATADDPTSLPWLIRLDEFVEGQDHQGYEDIVIRSNSSETSLNEAVALALLDKVGLASQAAIETSFSVNGSEARLRLATEHPDDDAWQESAFEEPGALYKAESTGDWSYRGDDPAAYEEVFDQEGGEDVADLTPLIEFLKFINESDDSTFASDLGARLDVDAFAEYLAMMDLVSNSDDIDGPGNNAYLWYDAASEQFTVVPWDMNLAFGVGFGAGGFPGGGELPEGFEPPTDGELPEGFEPPTDGELPEGFEPPTDGQLPQGGRAFGRSNVLVERFHEVAEFETLYQTKLAELRSELLDSGAAQDILDGWTSTLSEHATGLVDQTVIDEEAAAISNQF
jgi:spore coat protein CotH